MLKCCGLDDYKNELIVINKTLDKYYEKQEEINLIVRGLEFEQINCENNIKSLEGKK